MLVEISKEEYISLIMSSIRLERLEIGGVDNWTWYSDSLYPDDKEPLDVIEERLQNKMDEEKGVIKHDSYLRD